MPIIFYVNPILGAVIIIATISTVRKLDWKWEPIWEVILALGFGATNIGLPVFYLSSY